MKLATVIMASAAAVSGMAGFVVQRSVPRPAVASNYTAAVDPALASVEAGKVDFGEMWPEMKKQDRLPVAPVRVVATERVVVTPAPQAVETTEPGAVRDDTVPGHRRLDICERHHLVKVITRGGRSWRCRRVG